MTLAKLINKRIIQRHSFEVQFSRTLIYMLCHVSKWIRSFFVIIPTNNWIKDFRNRLPQPIVFHQNKVHSYCPFINIVILNFFPILMRPSADV